MDIIEAIKIIILGVIQGITEWLPISSTGHMLLADEFIQLSFSEEFKEMFFVLIQFGSILAVLVIFWKKIFPVAVVDNKLTLKQETMSIWYKVFIACLPSAVGLFIDDFLEDNFGTPLTIALMLIIYGIAFIIIENKSKLKAPKMNTVYDITYKTAVMIGFFQVLAMVPGTSRSGATIVGALLLGVSRVAASEFTFFLAIPTMFAASFVKMLGFGLSFSGDEMFALILAMVVAFVVSMLVINFLMAYIRKHDFKVFAWYRIILGIVVILYFGLVTGSLFTLGV